MATVQQFMPVIEDQAGDRYVFGAEARFSDPDPDRWDCSELIEWGLARVGVPFVDGAANQWRYCQTKGTVVTLYEGFATYGALLFRIGRPVNHVAVSLGNGTTFEARGRAYGVNTFPAARGRRWTGAARIPGLDYTTSSLPVLKPGDEMLNDTEAANLQQTHDAVARIEQALWTGNDSKNKPRGSIGALIARIAEKTEGQGLDLGSIKKKLGI